jgi:hypothetical protein
MDNPERSAHFLALAAGSGPDSEVAAALDAASSSAHARAATPAAAQFAEQAVLFTAAGDATDLLRRRIRAGELLFLAGEVERSLQQLEAVDVDNLADDDFERVLPLLVDAIYLVGGLPSAAAMVVHAVQTFGPDEHRRAVVFALGSDPAYGLREGRRAAADEAIRSAEAAGSGVAGLALHRALVNLAAAKVAAAEGLDGELLDRAAALEDDLTIDRLYDRADLIRGVWSACVEEMDASRAALRRCIRLARERGDLSGGVVVSRVPGVDGGAGRKLPGGCVCARDRGPSGHLAPDSTALHDALRPGGVADRGRRSRRSKRIARCSAARR